MRRCILKSNRLTDAEKDNIKEQLVADIERNESVALEMSAFNKETDDTLKQWSNDCLKTAEKKVQQIRKLSLIGIILRWGFLIWELIFSFLLFIVLILVDFVLFLLHYVVR